MRAMKSFGAMLASATALVSVQAAAAPTVDGTVDAEYTKTATVGSDPAAPTSNFQSPGTTARAGYDVYLTSANDKLYGAFAQTGGEAAGNFLNLYFDINPSSGNFGTEFVIEVANKRGAVAGTSNYFDLSSNISFVSSLTNGLITSEFSIDNSVFRDFIAGAALQGFVGTPDDIRIGLSQSLSYSVAGGGANFGNNGLGRFSAVAAVPEPATWAMMLIGFGMVAGAARYRRRSTGMTYA